MTRKEGALNAPTKNQPNALSILPTTSVITQNKGSDFQHDSQYHPCTLCGNWTLCVGYMQWIECKSRILRKGSTR